MRPITILLLALGIFSLSAHAGLERYKKTTLGELDTHYYQFTNTAKHPVTVRIAVNNNALYKGNQRTTFRKVWPAVTVKPGATKDLGAFQVWKGQSIDISDILAKKDEPKETSDGIREYRPGSWRNPTQAERDAAQRQKQLPPPSGGSTPTKQGKAQSEAPSKFQERLAEEFEKRLIGVWRGKVVEDRWNFNCTSEIEFRPGGSGKVTVKTHFRRPYGGADHWYYEMPFSYVRKDFGVWSATFSGPNTLSGDGSLGFGARSKSGTFTMIEGKALRGSRRLERDHNDFVKVR